MRNYKAALPPNNTALRVDALEFLDRYAYMVPWSMFGPKDMSMFKHHPWPGVAPTAQAFQSMPGLLALYLATVH
jgi:hypothetical protein